jgi:hypothetical protein
MKMIKFFEISYFSNFVSSLSFIGMIIYVLVEKPTDKDNFFFVSLFFAAFLFIVVPFNWICYSLDKLYKTSQQLSKKGRIAGTIFYTLFSLLTILELFGSYDIIAHSLTRNTVRDMRLLTFVLLFWSITISAIGLCISYWIIRKKTRIQFINVIAQLGDDTVS